jgi:hypothetical protein
LVHLPGVQSETHSLSEAAEFLEQFYNVITQWTVALNESRGADANASVDGSDGGIPTKTAKSPLMVARAARNLIAVINELNPDYFKVINLSCFLTVCVENFFSTMRARYPMPTMLEYAYQRIPAVKETAKLMSVMPFRMPSSRNRDGYSLADGALPFNDITWPAKPPSVTLPAEQIQQMKDYAKEGRGVRQRTPPWHARRPVRKKLGRCHPLSGSRTLPLVRT